MNKIVFIILFFYLLVLGSKSYSQKLDISVDTITIDSINYQHYLDLSKRLLNQYRVQQAKLLSEKLYSFDTSNIDGILQCAEVYTSLNNNVKTINFYKKAIEKDSLNIYPYLKLGEYYQKNNEYAEAISCYAPVVNILDTTNYFALKQSGVCMLELNNPLLYKIALNYLYRAMEINPFDLSIPFRIANTCNVMRLFDQSIETCQKGLSIDSLNTRLLTTMAYAQYNKSDFKQAAENFNKVLEMGDTSSFVIKNLGFTYYGDNQFEPAGKFLNKAVKMLDIEGQKDYDVFLFLSDISLQLNDPKSALSYLQKADSLRYPSPETQNRIYKSYAFLYNSEKDWENGAKYFELAYKNFPDDISTLLLLAYQHDYLKNRDKAYELYIEFIKIADPILFSKDLVIVNQRISKIKEDLFFEGKTSR